MEDVLQIFLILLGCACIFLFTCGVLLIREGCQRIFCAKYAPSTEPGVWQTAPAIVDPEWPMAVGSLGPGPISRSCSIRIQHENRRILNRRCSSYDPPSYTEALKCPRLSEFSGEVVPSVLSELSVDEMLKRDRHAVGGRVGSSAGDRINGGRSSLEGGRNEAQILEELSSSTNRPALIGAESFRGDQMNSVTCLEEDRNEGETVEQFAPLSNISTTEGEASVVEILDGEAYGRNLVTPDEGNAYDALAFPDCSRKASVQTSVELLHENMLATVISEVVASQVNYAENVPHASLKDSNTRSSLAAQVVENMSTGLITSRGNMATDTPMENVSGITADDDIVIGVEDLPCGHIHMSASTTTSVENIRPDLQNDDGDDNDDLPSYTAALEMLGLSPPEINL